jgi:hypothetical protein
VTQLKKPPGKPGRFTTLGLILAASAAVGIGATPATAHETYRSDRGYHAYYDNGHDRYDERRHDYRHGDWNHRGEYRWGHERRHHRWHNNYDQRGDYRRHDRY